jgi:hypothetical protein
MSEFMSELDTLILKGACEVIHLFNIQSLTPEQYGEQLPKLLEYSKRLATEQYNNRQKFYRFCEELRQITKQLDK